MATDFQRCFIERRQTKGGALKDINSLNIYVISAKAEIQALARSREPLLAITSTVKQKRRTSGRSLLTSSSG
jgi:hypothetical protein